MKNTFKLELSILLMIISSFGFTQPATYGTGATKMYVWQVTFPEYSNLVKQGYIYLPKEYFTTTKALPVIWYANPSLNQQTWNDFNGQPLVTNIHNGMTLDSIIGLDGQPYSPIVILGWDNSYPYIRKELQHFQDSLGISRIDTTRMYFTGASQGGLTAAQLMTNQDQYSCPVFAATVPMSPAPISANGQHWFLVNTYKIHSWFFGGSGDAWTLNSSGGAKVYSDSCNGRFPGSSLFLMFPGGHSGWETFYDKNWRDTITTTAYTTRTGLSIYQWMFQYPTGSGNIQTKKKLLPIIISSVNFNWLHDESYSVSFTASHSSEDKEYDVQESDDGINWKTVKKIPADGDRDYQEMFNL